MQRSHRLLQQNLEAAFAGRSVNELELRALGKPLRRGAPRASLRLALGNDQKGYRLAGFIGPIKAAERPGRSNRACGQYKRFPTQRFVHCNFLA
jgi:hypothetical protein